MSDSEILNQALSLIKEKKFNKARELLRSHDSTDTGFFSDSFFLQSISYGEDNSVPEGELYSRMSLLINPQNQQYILSYIRYTDRLYQRANLKVALQVLYYNSPSYFTSRNCEQLVKVGMFDQLCDIFHTTESQDIHTQFIEILFICLSRKFGINETRFTYLINQIRKNDTPPNLFDTIIRLCEFQFFGLSRSNIILQQLKPFIADKVRKSIEVKKHGKIKLLRTNQYSSFILHYNHFYGGFVAPFIEYIASVGAHPNEIFLFSYVHTMQDETEDTFDVCGVKDYLTVELNVLKVISEISPHLSNVELVDLPAYDAFWLPGFHASKFSRELVFNFLRRKYESLPQDHSLDFDKSKKKVTVAIRKKKSRAFSEVGRHAGASRKHLPNSKNLIDFISRNSDWSVNAYYFEDLRLLEKFALMQQTDLFIYQSGATMTSLYFLRKGSAVIEIVPRQAHSSTSPWSDGYGGCSILCDQIGLNHMRFFQEDNHAPVNVEGLYRIALIMLEGSLTTDD